MLKVIEHAICTGLKEFVRHLLHVFKLGDFAFFVLFGDLVPV